MIKQTDFAGMKVLVMGLGLNGGGIESARFFAGRGACVTVTDQKDEKALAPSVEKLKEFSIRYVLGKHEIEDFQKADLVIKNPGVKPDSPYLMAAKRTETDLSIFLAACPARIHAVTGSKGKSSTSSALHWVLEKSRKAALLPGTAHLGGNITLSPLAFLDKLEKNDDVVLELSSWQLGDLRGKDLLKPRTAVITSIMRDHLDRYGSMEAYVNDKRLIYANQDSGGATITPNDEWGKSFRKESRARPLVYSSTPLPADVDGGWISGSDGPALAKLWEVPPPDKISHNGNYRASAAGSIEEVVPASLLIPGSHQKQNLLAAALALLDIGLPPDFIRESFGTFKGIEHRLEFFHEYGGIKFYNDSAATIPEAAAAAVAAFEKKPVLVSGGNDKNLDFTPLALAAASAKAVILLDGTGSRKLVKLLESQNIKYSGPFNSLDGVIKAAAEIAARGDSVVLSPGCTSFGMFQNEFDRGTQWKEGVRKFFK